MVAEVSAVDSSGYGWRIEGIVLFRRATGIYLLIFNFEITIGLFYFKRSCSSTNDNFPETKIIVAGIFEQQLSNYHTDLHRQMPTL